MNRIDRAREDARMPEVGLGKTGRRISANGKLSPDRAYTIAFQDRGPEYRAGKDLRPAEQIGRCCCVPDRACGLSLTGLVSVPEFHKQGCRC